MNREEIADRAFKEYKKFGNIAIQWATSVGKSKFAIDIVKYEASKVNRQLKVLLLVTETAHINNWIEEIQKWQPDLLLQDITIECYASLKNYHSKTFDILILDEAHHAGTDLRLDIFSSLKATNVILLSATLSQDIIDTLVSIYGKFGKDVVSLQEAIDWNILSKPKIFLIPLVLDTIHKNQEVIEEWGKTPKKVEIHCDIKDLWNYKKYKDKYPNVKLVMTCTEAEKNQYLTNLSDYYKKLFFRTQQEHVKSKWLRLGGERKRFLGNLKSSYLTLLLTKLESLRYICFCASIEQAELVGNINAIIHSKKTNCDVIIKALNNKTIDHMYAINMLQEGQNLVDIDAGIITQLDGTERSFIQRFGRVLRSKEPLQFIFYYINTKDQEYLDKVLENIDKSYIQVINNLEEFKI